MKEKVIKTDRPGGEATPTEIHNFLEHGTAQGVYLGTKDGKHKFGQHERVFYIPVDLSETITEALKEFTADTEVAKIEYLGTEEETERMLFEVSKLS